MFEGYGVGDPIIYWVLKIILLSVLIYSGWGISYDNPSKFKKYAWLSIIIYSLIQGLRWLRGADYPHYYNDLVTLFGKFDGGIGFIVTPDPEPLYKLWVTIFYYSGMPFWIAFIIYSAILISPLLLILKKIPKAAIWALPLFFILTSSSENLIRQYISESCLLFAYYFYLCEKRKKMIVSLICVPLIHFSGTIFVILFLIIAYIPNFIRKYFDNKYMLWILLAFFIFSYFYFDLSYFSTIADFLSKNINLNESQGSAYIDNADRWFSDEGSMATVLGKKATTFSFINKASQFITFISIIYFGYLTKKIDKRLNIAYWFSYFAIILKTIGGDIEMYARFYNWCVIFQPIVIGVFLNNFRTPTFFKYTIYCVFALYFLYYSFFIMIFSTSMFGYGFIWDS